MDPGSSPETILPRHALNEGANVGSDAWSSGSPPRPWAAAFPKPLTTPTDNRGRLDKHQGVFPPRPTPLQAEPEQAVGRTKASIRPSEDAQLVSQGENLEEDVYTPDQGRPERRDRPVGVTHRCRIARRYASANDFVPDAILARDTYPTRGHQTSS